MIVFDAAQIEKYSHSDISGTGYLAFRDLQKFSQFHAVKTEYVLDLGCGCGRSTGFLKQFCTTVIGVDVSTEALAIAKKNYPDNNFFLNDILQHNHGAVQFDAVFSIQMIFHLVSVDEVHREFSKVFNSLKNEQMAPIENHAFPLVPLPLERLNGGLDVDPPPLIKGYLKLGAKICSAPAWDPQFNTADVLTILRLDEINPRYAKHFFGTTE